MTETTKTSRRTYIIPADLLERVTEIAEQMCAHLEAHQDPSYRVLGSVWAETGRVRIYTNKHSYAEFQVEGEGDEGEISYRHVGRDRGSVRALEEAWAAAE